MLCEVCQSKMVIDGLFTCKDCTPAFDQDTDCSCDDEMCNSCRTFQSMSVQELEQRFTLPNPLDDEAIIQMAKYYTRE